MASQTQTILNPDAPEFFPTLQHKLLLPLPPTLPYFSTPIIPILHHCFTPTLTPHQQPIIVNHITHVSQLPEPTSSEKQQQQLMMMNHIVGFNEDSKQSASMKEILVAAGGDGALKSPVFRGTRGNGFHRRRMNGGDEFKTRPVKSYAAWRKKGTCDDDKNRHYYYDHLRQVQCLNACPNKKKHALLPPIREDGEGTTIMIKNIPAKYSRDTLVEFLDNHCMSENSKDHEGGVENEKERTVLAFDFVYLPIDFRSGLNKGYAFVNFTSPKAAWKFSVTASDQRWDLFQSNKRRQVVYARLQGKEKLQRHFETMHFPCQYEEVLPVFYSPPRDGATKGEPRTVGKLQRRRQHHQQLL